MEDKRAEVEGLAWNSHDGCGFCPPPIGAPGGAGVNFRGQRGLGTPTRKASISLAAGFARRATLDPGTAQRRGEDLLARFDRCPLTRLHLLALALCTLAFAFDLMEVAFGGALSAVFSAPPYRLSATELSWLLSSLYIGAIVGTSTMGLLADRVGRRAVLSGLLVVLAVTSALAGASRTPAELTLARGLSGFALGAFPPLMVVLLTDLLPARRRGPAIMLVSGFAFLGAPLGVFLLRYLTPIEPYGLEAWRWVFILGAVGSGVLSVAIAWWVPESPRWLLARGRVGEAQALIERFERSRPVLPALPPRPAAAALATASASLHGRRGFVLLGSIFFLAAWSTVAFPILSGAVMIEKGIRLNDTLLYVGVATFGPAIGSIAVAAFADVVERRSALMGCAVLILVSMLSFMVSELGVALAVTGLCVTLLSALYVPLMNLYGAEVAAGGSRGGVVSGAWACNRVGAAIAPLLLLPLLKNAGAGAMFAIMSASLLLSLWVLAVAPRGQASRAVA